MFLAWPGTLISYQADTNSPWSYSWIGFSGLDADVLIRHTDFTVEAPVLRIADGEAVQRLLLDIYEARGVRPHEIARMTGRVYTFLSWLMENASPDTRQSRKAGLEHVERACTFIANHFSSPITIADIASGVGVCRSLLNRAFQQHLHESPVQYLTRYRMQQACALLKRTDMSIKAVAYSVGFEDPLYFSRRFHKMLGCSPKEYVARLSESDGAP